MLVSLLAGTAKCSHLPNVTFSLPTLGPITGVEKRTKTYDGAPHSDRPMYTFRAIPYAHPVIDQQRFQQSKIWNDSALTEDGSVFDATRDGPLCQQGNSTNEMIQNIINSTVKDLALSIVPEEFQVEGIIDVLIVSLLGVLEKLLELEEGFLAPDRMVGDVLHEWLDLELAMSEDCLHLAVYTPWKPDGTKNGSLPVMFFIHGGAFAFGTQLRMAGDRLQAWGDVVVVSINYRVGPLGFLCLNTDEAGGNMGMLDMVVSLEWAHQYIEYFGGNPNEITIFGESAGSASIGHLLLSKETNGLFAQGIGQSGGAIASWAFDSNAGEQGVEVARLAGCSEEQLADHDLIVECLRAIPAENVSTAYYYHSKNQRRDAYDGFGGTTPCSQTHGARKFYEDHETPQDILYDGNYEHVPIMFGANSHEGSYVYGVVYNDFMEPNNLTKNETFLRYDIIHTLMQVVDVSNSYAVEYMIEKEYFEDWMMGNLTLMQPGLIDLLSVFFLKASSYEFMAQNSKYEDSYWYAFDYQPDHKTVFNLLFMSPEKKAGVQDSGVCHGDELIYMFDMELPLLLCDIGAVLGDVLQCLPSTEDIAGCVINFEDCVNSAVNCTTNIDGPVRSKWHDCFTGQTGRSLQHCLVFCLLSSLRSTHRGGATGLQLHQSDVG